MANLTNLLNPAPSAGSPQTPQSPSQPAPLILDGQDQLANSTAQGYGQMRGHGRNNSVPSPGLDALATAASMSPTQPSAGFGALQQQTYSDFGLRNKPLETGLDQYGQSARTLSALPPPTAPMPPTPTAPMPSTLQDLQPPPSLPAYESNIPSFGGASNEDETKGGEEASQADSQIAELSLSAPQTLADSALPPIQGEQVQVKTEMPEHTPAAPQNGLDQLRESAQLGAGTGLGLTLPDVSIEMPAPQTVSDIKTDPSNAASPAPTDEQAGTSSKKQKPPPKRKRAPPKKGTASTVKPPAKKRKVDSESIDDSPSGQRVGTPATSRASMTPAPKNRNQTSATPTPRSSSVANGQEDEDYEDDDQLFCICRKPDDHRMMIGCDGPCDDWFHLNCVSMNEEKVALISKWYCPNCAEKGLETLWQRKCRLEGCEKPAINDTKKKQKSKYCSEAHAIEFMTKRVFPVTAEANGGPASNKRKRRSNYTDNDGTEPGLPNAIDDEDHDYIRGGVLKPNQLRALIDGAEDVTAFRKLGDGVLSPPKTASPEAEGKTKDNKVSYTDSEKSELEQITSKRQSLNEQKAMLIDKDKLIAMVAARGKATAAEVREKDKSLKDICGYDSRLTWADEEFNHWRISPAGMKALETNVLEPPPLPPSTTKNEDNNDGGGGEEELGRGVCKKKHSGGCARHRLWLKVWKENNGLEKDLVRKALRGLEAEEKDVRDRALIRVLEAEGEDEDREVNGVGMEGEMDEKTDEKMDVGEG